MDTVLPSAGQIATGADESSEHYVATSGTPGSTSRLSNDRSHVGIVQTTGSESSSGVHRQLIEPRPPVPTGPENHDFETTNPQPNISDPSISMMPPTTNPVPSTMEFPSFSFDEDMFLEDTLLFQFNYNHSGLTIPSTPNLPGVSLPNISDSSITSIQLATPESAPDLRPDTSVHNALHINTDELQMFHAKLTDADPHGDLHQFRRPSLSRTLRCLIAYFQHFDPHTPIVHFASFKIYETHRK